MPPEKDSPITPAERYDSWETYASYAAYSWLCLDEYSIDPNDSPIVKQLVIEYADRPFILAEKLKQAVQENSPVTTGLYADWIDRSIRITDWTRLAEALIEQFT